MSPLAARAARRRAKPSTVLPGNKHSRGGNAGGQRNWSSWLHLRFLRGERTAGARGEQFGECIPRSLLTRQRDSPAIVHENGLRNMPSFFQPSQTGTGRSRLCRKEISSHCMVHRARSALDSIQYLKSRRSETNTRVVFEFQHV